MCVSVCVIVCVIVNVFDLGTSKLRQARPDLDCSAQKKNSRHYYSVCSVGYWSLYVLQKK